MVDFGWLKSIVAFIKEALSIKKHAVHLSLFSGVGLIIICYLEKHDETLTLIVRYSDKIYMAQIILGIMFIFYFTMVIVTVSRLMKEKISLIHYRKKLIKNLTELERCVLERFISEDTKKMVIFDYEDLKFKVRFERLDEDKILLFRGIQKQYYMDQEEDDRIYEIANWAYDILLKRLKIHKKK